jgi:Fic family protein
MPIPISVSDLPPVTWRRVQSNLKELRSRRPLPRDIMERLRQQLRLYHTYNSNAIEGNTLSLKETRLILEQGITIGGRSVREHLEATDNAEAFDWIWKSGRPGLHFDHAPLKKLHEMVTKGTLETPWQYRQQQVWIGGSAHVPPPPSKIVPRLDELFKELPAIREPVLRSVYLHHRLSMIHPFLDGNGRTARLAANLVLIGAGYPPVVLRVEDRRRYYKGLDEADRGRYGPFSGFVLHAVDEGLTVFLSAVDAERALVPLRQLVRGSAYSQEYLSLRARQGMLEAVKIGRTWYSSKRALAQYTKTVQSKTPAR